MMMNTTTSTTVRRNSVRSMPRRLRYAVDSPPNVDERPVPRGA